MKIQVTVVCVLSGLFVPDVLPQQTANAELVEQTPKDDRQLAAAAQVDEPASATKLVLIRRFLQLNGTQAAIDNGSILDRYARSAALVNAASRDGNISLLDALMGPVDALRDAYRPHRNEYQEAFEAHVNWEFTEEELRRIVAFLETSEGQHFLDGRWRMEAYTETNMEGLTEQIILEAAQKLKEDG